MVLLEVLRVAATLAALAVFFTPLETARRILRERSVGALTPLPFAAIGLNGAIWSVYGAILRDWVPLVVSNSVGLTSGVYCLTVFAAHAPQPRRGEARRLRAAVVVAFCGLALASRGALARGARAGGAPALAEDAAVAATIGRVGVVACVAMFASPLASAYRVVRTRSTASLAPSVTVASLACALLWTWYGRLMGDVYLWGPNAVGLGFASLQCLLFVKYGLPPPARSAPGKAELV